MTVQATTLQSLSRLTAGYIRATVRQITIIGVNEMGRRLIDNA